MSNDQYKPYVLDNREDGDGSADRVLKWWARLAHDEALFKQFDTPAYPPAVRSMLRRASEPDEILLSEGFRNLWFSLPEARRRSWDMRAWGSVAAVLAEIRHHEQARTFALAMASPPDDKSDNPRVSELRFNQLLRSNDLDELTRRARRAVHLIGDQANVVSVADDILHWHQEHSGRYARRPDRRLAVRWASDYFTRLAR